MSLPDNTNHVRRVLLPSGRAQPVSGVVHERVDLHVCPECEKELVYPVEWEEASPTHWEVQLRCPNCEWLSSGLYDQETVDRFDAHLDHGTEALVRDLKRLTQANMEDEVERFSSALASDAIWPMDF